MGQGDGNVSGNVGWATNSSNPIGNGWDGFRYLFGAGSSGQFDISRLYGVETNGDLRWYVYKGKGESDVSGNTGFASMSSTIIGNGW